MVDEAYWMSYVDFVEVLIQSHHHRTDLHPVTALHYPPQVGLMLTAYSAPELPLFEPVERHLEA